MSKSSLQNCSKCGLCLTVCPVYKELREESASPRARLQQIKAYEKNDLAFSSDLKKTFNKCLMCGTCTANCPSGVDHYAKFMEMKEKMAADQGEPLAIRSMIYCLANENRLKLAARLARTGQALFPDAVGNAFKVGNIPISNLPEINKIPFRKAHDTVILPKKEPVGTVVYFTGCATNYMFDDTGIATIGVLSHMGYRVVIPEDQTCCSLPLFFHGAKDQALKNITRNINALTGHDPVAVLVDCSTCGEALKNEYPHFFPDKTNTDAQNLSAKVMDILTFVDMNFDRLTFEKEPVQKHKVTYHAPCHTKNSFGSHLIAETLLQRLPNIEYMRTPDFDQCCGGGGTFFYEYPDISKKMIEKKVGNAKALAVDYWATDCPVCRINLSGNLNKADNICVVHPLQLIFKALDQKGVKILTQ